MNKELAQKIINTSYLKCEELKDKWYSIKRQYEAEVAYLSQYCTEYNLAVTVPYAGETHE